MKRLIILILFLIPLATALTITEIESNPQGQDIGNEKIEFYSEQETDLSEYKIINNDQDEIQLSGTNKGYFTYILEKQWLDNTDEKIFLYKNNELIQETLLFEDSENNDKTHQLCNNSWKFDYSTFNLENNCPQPQPDPEPEEPEQNQTQPEPQNQTQEQDPQEPQQNKTETQEPIKLYEDKEDKEKETKKQETKQIIESQKEKTPPKTIYLNPQTIKTQENSFTQKKSKKPIYFLIGFCILLVILFFIQNKNKNKNEFRD
jgi:hypothetical protein